MNSISGGSRTTQADLTYQLGVLADELRMVGIDSTHLSLQSGSKTYGRAFRLFYRDPKTGGLSDVPTLRSSYLGMTKAEASLALRFLVDGLRIARDASGRVVSSEQS